MVSIKLESINLEPKENNSRKLLFENSNAGRHFPYIHRKTVFINCREICCPTRLHTPHPPYAIPIPTAPLDKEAIRDTFVCVLKSTFRTNRVRCIIASALISRTTPMTRVTFTKTGCRKNSLIQGAATYNSAYMATLTTKLK